MEKWKEKFDFRPSSDEEDVEPVFVLVGCKTDLAHMRQVNYYEDDIQR